MGILRGIWRREDGVSGVVMAVSFSLAVALCALVADLGSAYVQGSRIQNAADAAALAAAARLPVAVEDICAQDQVWATAADYVAKNGFTADSIQSVTLQDVVDGSYTAVSVVLSGGVAYGFGAILGTQGTTVTRQAKAGVVPATGTSNVVPLGIQAETFVTMMDACGGQDVIVKFDGGGGTTGFFGAIDLDGVQGGGARDFSTWLAFGYDGVLRVGDVLPVESGNMAGPTITSFTTRYSQCTHFPSDGGCTAEHFDADCPRVVTMIVYTMEGSKNVKVEGFAPFVLKGVNGNGEIVASWITMNDGQGEASQDADGYGLYKISLME